MLHETEKKLATMGGKSTKKERFQMLPQPKHMSAKGSYYTASWSVKLCGAGFLVLVDLDPAESWCSLLSRCVGTAVPEPFLPSGAKPSMPLGSGGGL